MTQLLSAQPTKPCPSSRRKGTRSLSVLTPFQLARKRANDRKAQRASRARTKEHIERLERELEVLRDSQGRDKTVQELLHRNKTLESKIRQLKECMGALMTSSPYSTRTVYTEDNCGAIPRPRMRTLRSGGAIYIPDYSQATQQYVTVPSGDTWSSTFPSSVSSASSSLNTDDYGRVASSIPTSVPSSMMGTANFRDGKEAKMEFKGMDGMIAAQGYMQQT